MLTSSMTSLVLRLFPKQVIYYRMLSWLQALSLESHHMVDMLRPVLKTGIRKVYVEFSQSLAANSANCREISST